MYLPFYFLFFIFFRFIFKICKKRGHVHTALFKMDNQRGLTVKHRELCSMYVAAWITGEFGGEWIHVYAWLSPFGVHLKLS